MARVHAMLRKLKVAARVSGRGVVGFSQGYIRLKDVHRSHTEDYDRSCEEPGNDLSIMTCE